MLGLIMLTFLLCDVVSTCPEELNPLSLDPPEVVKQYGEKVLVNCSTAEDGEMYWVDGSEESNIEKEIMYFAILLKSNWKATCKIRLNETFECSKDLKITVYKNPDEVFLRSVKPVNPTVEGTQHELQCDIINVAPVHNLTVSWYKDNQIVEKSYFSNQTKVPMNKYSILTVNISRGDNGSQFRCEAQLDSNQQTAVTSNVLNVSVNYAPEFINNTAVFYVKEGAKLTLNCEADANPPPVYHLTSNGVLMSENINNFTITPVKATETYICTASNPLGSINKQISVYVIKNMSAPEAPMTTPDALAPKATPAFLTLIPAEVVVRFGDPVNINCSSSTPNIEGMGWEASTGGTEFKNTTSVLWVVQKLEVWEIIPLCYVTLQDGDQHKQSPVITIYKTPDSVSVSAHGQMVEGTETLMKCDIISVHPVQNLVVKWYRDNETVHTEMFNGSTGNNQNQNLPCNMTVYLTVTPTRTYNGALFTCKAELHLGPYGPDPVPSATSEPYTAVVHYKPLIKGCPSRYAGVEHNFSLNMLPCEPDGNPQPAVSWYFQDKLINASQLLTRSQSGNYTAEVANNLGRSTTSVSITIEYSPSFTCKYRYEVEDNDKPQAVKCEADGKPTPSITWFKDGTTKFDPVRWTQHDNGTYLLEATNKHGTANHTIYVDVLYAPKFKQGNVNEEIILGGNETFDCLADGNPVPQVWWNYTSANNVMETTEGRQKTVTVTGATSTNTGVYICVATNKFGTVTRSVTVRIKDKTTGGFSWWFILLIIPIIFVVIFFLLKFYKKRGQYSFKPVNTDMPLTTKSAPITS